MTGEVVGGSVCVRFRGLRVRGARGYDGAGVAESTKSSAFLLLSSLQRGAIGIMDNIFGCHETFALLSEALLSFEHRSHGFHSFAHRRPVVPTHDGITYVAGLNRRIPLSESLGVGDA